MSRLWTVIKCKWKWGTRELQWVSYKSWLKETNGDNDIQTFIFQHNLHTHLNTFPTVSQVPGNLRRKILCRLGNLHRPTDSTFVFDIRSPLRELLNPIMTGNVHRTWTAFLCGYPLLPYLFPTKTAQRHIVLLWYTSSGAPPSCNSLYRSVRVTIKLDSAAILPPLWSSGQGSWLQIQRFPGSIQGRYQIFWIVVGLERGPLSLVRSIEELLE
jgi:hypothetical protein